MPFVILWLAVIIAAPIIIIKYACYKRNLNYKRQISLDVKNRLISTKNYGEIGKDMIFAVKKSLIRSSVIESMIITGFFSVVIIAELLWHVNTITVMCTVGAYIIVLLIFAARYVFAILRLSTPQKLIKIKGFIFRKDSNGFSILYYDMPRMEYRIFTQNSFIKSEELAVPGAFVNLIGIRTDKKVKIIRMLSF